MKEKSKSRVADILDIVAYRLAIAGILGLATLAILDSTQPQETTSWTFNEQLAPGEVWYYTGIMTVDSNSALFNSPPAPDQYITVPIYDRKDVLTTENAIVFTSPFGDPKKDSWVGVINGTKMEFAIGGPVKASGGSFRIATLGGEPNVLKDVKSGDIIETRAR